MVLILTAYFLISNKKVKPMSRIYQAMNFFGAIGIVINTLVNKGMACNVSQCCVGYLCGL